MTLVDSSSWVEALRPRGNPLVSSRVASLLDAGEAAWCDMVRLELWRGARAGDETRALQHIENSIRLLPITPDVWTRAVPLMKKARRLGVSVPAADVVIVATSLIHGVALEHNDEHLARLLEIA